MEKVYDLHKYTHCIILEKTDVTACISSTSNRQYDFRLFRKLEIGSSISYIIDNFRVGLYSLFKKNKTSWDEEDEFLMKAVSDYLPLAVKNIAEISGSEIESFDLFHYVFIVPSEWEEEMREDIIRPIFVQSGLISNEDHQDRLLFFSDIEFICYGLKDENDQTYSFKRGQNTILCRLTSDEGKIVVKFDLIQTSNTLFNVPNATLFPKVMKSSSVLINIDDIEGRIKDFLRTNLFPMATDDHAVRKSLKFKFVPVNQDQIIEDLIKVINNWRFGSLVIIT
ncbi:hypothetical protein MFLAVUS_006241 [Mucor flavus]|uniref:DUF3822 family protein n=1 Tax=Mucor flavus TaxID=439312 RepID=A0ABP9Z0Z5_9FUNG